MCGIFGILSMEGKLDRIRFRIPNETSILEHRGPDDFGNFIDGQVYLGHRRLSIIDLASGGQPIFNEDQTSCVVFNGEIYNFQEIKSELEARGHHFTTNSDTEVIIHAYEEFGEKCIDRFRGMFAFAIWDDRNQVLFLARDRLGIKPLFYALHEGVFYFASEMKAILQYRDFPREIDQDGLASYFSLSYIPAPLTIFKHIRKLLPGHFLEIRGGKVRTSQYWDVSFNPDRSKKQDYFVDGFIDILEEAVKLRLISDVPLGAFLSGGIDSGTIVALMSRFTTEPVRTFTVGFGGNIGGYLDERQYATQVASKYDTFHSEYEAFPNFQCIVEDIIKAFDEPFADHSTIPTYYISKAARESVKVALSGLGGDELFGGYERYLGLKLSNLYNLLPKMVREKIIKEVIEKLPERADGHYTVNHIKRFIRSASLPHGVRYYKFSTVLGDDKEESFFSEPEKYRENLDYCQELFLRYFNRLNPCEPLDRVFYTDIKTYLPEDILACTDRMSMWHALEVRVPFLDHKLVEFCATIPSEMKIRLWDKKYILKKALLNVLPRDVLTHRKQGFEGPMTSGYETLSSITRQKFSARVTLIGTGYSTRTQ